MFSGEYRRSPRIVELDARKAQQARSQNKGNGICEVMDGEELDKGEDIVKHKRRRKKVKVRTVQDLIVNSVEYKVQKADTWNVEDQLVNAAMAPSGAALPEKSKLELLLGVLQRRDTHKIFAEPVNPEEVEYYYDVIKEPMDFGTIAKKLNEGSYQRLDEFEHDVFLVSNNAMLFNASNTVYYRQARALKELATRLLHALKTDPENFEAEASMRRIGAGRRKKAEVNSNKKTSIGNAARGYRAERQSDDFEVEKRRTYRPWNTFLSEKASLLSEIYRGSNQLKLDEKVGVGYVESVKRFAKDLGPTAQTTAMKKVGSYIAEALKVWNATTNRQSWTPQMQIPNAAFASKNIKVAPSFRVPSSTPGYQNMSRDKMDILTGFSNGGQASSGNTLNINDALNRGVSQPGSRLESLGNFRGKMTQSASLGFAPSFRVPPNAPGYQNMSGDKMDIQSGFLNGGQASTCNTLNINDALNRGVSQPGSRLESLGEFPGKLTQSVSLGFAPSVRVSSSTPGYQNMSGGEMDIQSGFSNGGQTSTGDTLNINDALNRGVSQPDSRLESLGDFRGKMTQSASLGFAPSLHLLGNSNGSQMFAGETMGAPFSSWNGGKVSAVNNIDINDALNGGKGNPGNRMDFRGKAVQTMGGGLDSGPSFKDYTANQSNGVQLGSCFANYDSGKEKLDFTSSWNTNSNQKELSMMVDTIDVGNAVQTAGQASLGSTMQEFTPTIISGASSSSWLPPSQVLTGLNSSQAIDHMSGIGSHYAGKGLCQKEAIADGEGSRYTINVEQGGQVPDWFKPLEMGPLPLTEYCFQEQTKSPEMTTLMQQKRDIDLLCNAPPLEDWLGSFPNEHGIRASSNASGYERLQPPSRGESSSRAAADRRQKQPMLGTEMPKWSWL
ncbi:Bromodomain - like 2 [Theobroma cacao]|nr:Bromodomain - like 2 [Theobroma cacao]